MKHIEIQSSFGVIDKFSTLDHDIQDLFKQAEIARKEAYAPYSKFLVGCSILLDNGKIISGSNQENASYPSGLCAERTAIFYAGAKYPKAKILKMAIIAGSTMQKTSTPIPPCGACRQVIYEYEHKQVSDIEIYFKGEFGSVLYSKSIANMLPLTFNSSFL